MRQEAAPILVTGGAGFIGSWVLRRFLEIFPATSIAILDDLRTGRAALLPPDDRLDVHVLDITDSLQVRDLILRLRPRLVVHLAAVHFIPYCNSHPSETLQVNVIGTQNLLDACRVHPPQSLVLASTAAVYGVSERPHSEDEAVDPQDLYGLTKAINERQLQFFAREAPTRCACARLFNVYGPNETNPHVIPEILAQIMTGTSTLSLGNTAPKRDYIYVTDVADALVTVATRNAHSFRTFNVGTGTEYSVVDIVETLARVVERPLSIEVSAERARKTDRMHLQCDPHRVSSEFGWQARHDLTSGLRTLWQSMLAGVHP